MSTPSDIGKSKKTNKLTPPPATEKVSAAAIPKAPNSVSNDAPIDLAALPSPEQLQASVQDKVNDKIAAAIVNSAAMERESGFDADFVNNLYNEPLGGRSAPAPAPPPAPASVPKKKSAAAAMASVMPPKDPGAVVSNSLVEKYGRYYNTRREAHPALRWKSPEEFARMRESDQQLLYREIYVAENSKGISPPVLSQVLVQTAKYLSALSVIANANGLLAEEHTIGFDTPTRKSFYTLIKQRVDAGDFDDDLAQFWCEYADYFNNTGPAWRMAMKTMAALGESIQPSQQSMSSIPPSARPPTTPLPAATAAKASSKLGDL